MMVIRLLLLLLLAIAAFVLAISYEDLNRYRRMRAM